MQRADTKIRLLEAAERLFATEGLSRTSLRAITCEAGVNVAAVHYHFGSKDELLVELLRRRIAPMNEERLGRLEAIEERANGGPLPLEPVLRAFIEPAFRFRSEMNGQDNLGRLIGRLYSEPEEVLDSTLREVFEDVASRFRGAFARALPDLSARDVDWRFQFIVGAVVHTLLGRREHYESNPEEIPENEIMERLVDFAAAGLRTPRGTVR